MTIQIEIKDHRVVIPYSGKKNFSPNVEITLEQFNQCLLFAKNMAYGGNHQTFAFGGRNYNRSEGEIFKNALQGKLAEVGFYNYYTLKGKEIPYPDFGVWERGIWEDSDVIINNLKISIKSTKHFGNLLLLECDRYSIDGMYLEPATKGDDPIKHDLIYLIRVKGIDSINPSEYKFENVQVEITGYITHNEFLDIIKNDQKINSGSILGIPLIVDNYYVCCSDLHKP